MSKAIGGGSEIIVIIDMDFYLSLPIIRRLRARCKKAARRCKKRRKGGGRGSSLRDAFERLLGCNCSCMRACARPEGSFVIIFSEPNRQFRDEFPNAKNVLITRTRRTCARVRSIGRSVGRDCAPCASVVSAEGLSLRRQLCRRSVACMCVKTKLGLVKSIASAPPRATDTIPLSGVSPRLIKKLSPGSPRAACEISI